MTVEQILADIRSDRVKKVIFDSDTCCEIDDQFALAYALGSDRIEVIAAIGAPCSTRRDAKDVADSADKSYAETVRILKAAHKDDVCPAYVGSPVWLTDQPDFAPVSFPGAEAIIRYAMESDEIIYVLATGPATDAAAALMMEPAIKDKICVVFIGSTCLEAKYLYEGNINQDYRASQILINSGVPFVLLPAAGAPGKGTVMLDVKTEEFRNELQYDSDICTCLRETLLPKKSESYIYWDLAAPAFLSAPEGFKFDVIPAPVFTDDKAYAYDSTRHKIIYMDEIYPDIIMKDVYRCLRNL